MRDEAFDCTLIVPKLEPPPTRKLVVQFAPRRETAYPWLWFVGAIVLALGFLQPLERVDQGQLERAESAQTS